MTENRARLLPEIRPGAEAINCVVWSRDGSWLATGSFDHTVRIWNPNDGREVRCFRFPEDYAWKLSWSTDSAFLASTHSEDIIRFWDTRDLAASAATEKLRSQPHARPPHKTQPPASQCSNPSACRTDCVTALAHPPAVIAVARSPWSAWWFNG